MLLLSVTVSHVLGLWTLCDWSWPWTPDPPVPISKMLGLRACANIKIFFIKKNSWWYFWIPKNIFIYYLYKIYIFFLLILEIFLNTKDKRKIYQMIPKEMKKFTYKRKHIWAKYCSCLKGEERHCLQSHVADSGWSASPNVTQKSILAKHKVYIIMMFETIVDKTSNHFQRIGRCKEAKARGRPRFGGTGP